MRVPGPLTACLTVGSLSQRTRLLDDPPQLVTSPTGGVTSSAARTRKRLHDNSFNYVKEAEWVTRPLLDSEGRVLLLWPSALQESNLWNN